MASAHLLKAIAATAELCGKTFTPAAASILASDLEGYPEAAILVALTRCRRELDGKPFNVAAIIARIEDGRPGVEQAWAMLPHDEDTSTVWTEEMAAAWGAARALLNDGDRIGARMAFKEIYPKLVADAREARVAPKWTPSFGRDAAGRVAALEEAVRHQRIGVRQAVDLLPGDQAEGLLRTLGVTKHPLLAPPSREGQVKVKALLASLKGIGHRKALPRSDGAPKKQSADAAADRPAPAGGSDMEAPADAGAGLEA